MLLVDLLEIMALELLLTWLPAGTMGPRRTCGWRQHLCLLGTHDMMGPAGAWRLLQLEVELAVLGCKDAAILSCLSIT